MLINQKEPSNGSLIPPALFPQMAKLQMLWRKRDNSPWEPTAYGRSLGLDRIEAFGPLVVIPDRTKLDEALAWSQAPHKLEDPHNWSEIMERADQGLLCNSDYAASVAAALGSMSLTELMADNPSGLQFLCRELDLNEDATYQEAADGVYRICMSQRQSEDDYCTDLIFTLAEPFYQALYHMKFPAF